MAHFEQNDHDVQDAALRERQREVIRLTERNGNVWTYVRADDGRWQMQTPLRVQWTSTERLLLTVYDGLKTGWPTVSVTQEALPIL